MVGNFLKNKLFRTIFKKELKEYFNLVDCEYKRRVSNLNYEHKKNIKKYNLAKRIFDLFPSAQIIGIDKNKNDDELFIAINSNTLYLLGERYQGPVGLPRIFFKN